MFFFEESFFFGFPYTRIIEDDEKKYSGEKGVGTPRKGVGGCAAWWGNAGGDTEPWPSGMSRRKWRIR